MHISFCCDLMVIRDRWVLVYLAFLLHALLSGCGSSLQCNHIPTPTGRILRDKWFLWSPPCTSSPFAVWLIAIVAFQCVHAFSPLPVLQDWLMTCPTHQLCFPTLPGLHFQSFPLHLHKTTFYNTFPIVFECLSFLVYEHSWCVSGQWFTFHYSVKLAELVI